MSDSSRLEALLRRLDGGPYSGLKRLRGRWELGDVVVQIDHVQGDPFAAPSRVRLLVQTDLPSVHDPGDRVAVEDWLLRHVAAGLVSRKLGSGRSGELALYRPGPEITRRSSLILHEEGLAEVRMGVGLPARGRRVLGEAAYTLLTDDVVRAARRLRSVAGAAGLAAQRASALRQRGLRAQLDAAGLVAFVADGAVLPRASGVETGPLRDPVPFRAPDGLAVTLDSPAGPVRGLGVPRGVTLITGGGFHGKSTLLQAIQRGHLDHIPGDGREGVVALPSTTKVRAEDGRAVASVDISALLAELPGGRATRPFSTLDASGSTSQAAGLVEAVEAGARVLLLDEDTSATNLLVRDGRMAQLIPAALEPITPLVARARQLVSDWGLSLVLVVGGVGDYLAVADHVIGMDRYLACDWTARAAALAGPVPAPPGPLRPPMARVPQPDGLQPGGRGRVRARRRDRVEVGESLIDLGAVEQILDAAHARTLGQALRVMATRGLLDGRATTAEVLDRVAALLDEEGLDALSPFPEPVGDLIWPRRQELAAALSRHRGLQARTLEPA